LITQILHNWKEKFGGYIQKDKRGLYEGDYYLNFSEIKDNKTHVHLITHNFTYPSFELIPSTRIGYVVKKDTKHLEPVKINETDNPEKICLDMIKLYENFDMNYYNSK
jgi:hypothetical protein